MRTFTSLFALLAATALPAAAQDGSVIGKPHSGGLGFQTAATELARDQQWLDGMILVIISAIVLLVVALLFVVILRYNSRFNPKPAKFTHNTPVEVVWTILPVMILVVIGVFSLPVLFKQQEIPEGDITIKVTGNQWYWSYEYTDFDDVTFDSYMIGQPATMTAEDDTAGAEAYILSDAMKAKLIKSGYRDDEFLLAVDNAVVVPVNKVIVMDVTGSDVIHSWTVPAFGVKQDAVPGRIAQLWFKPEVEGVFFGQCSELCGKDHAYMPIAVKVVSQARYDAWIAATQAAGEYVDVNAL
ncbi:cytochrome c oxidase subunit II [Pseudooceanicola sp.]|uniref:cytochrome c oxidase subunit II n=1 Tax=Pseudooceanicola sp. TaxID=1914328 RepID=UPI002613A754|nr:cytochrome c oxidase subunit II [Pseudooceanicola sp.]MDF1856210.1 cytochrome c oxidase subunit II [Pseudooceanicola sp.]